MKSARLRPIVDTEPCEVPKWNDATPLAAGVGWVAFNQQRVVDQVVVNHGTLPLDDLYFDLRPLSTNGGAVEQHDLIAGTAQNIVTHPEGRFQLFRIGDAVSARNTHAAIYDALRLVKEI